MTQHQDTHSMTSSTSPKRVENGEENGSSDTSISTSDTESFSVLEEDNVIITEENVRNLNRRCEYLSGLIDYWKETTKQEKLKAAEYLKIAKVKEAEMRKLKQEIGDKVLEAEMQVETEKRLQNNLRKTHDEGIKEMEEIVRKKDEEIQKLKSEITTLTSDRKDARVSKPGPRNTTPVRTPARTPARATAAAAAAAPKKNIGTANTTTGIRIPATIRDKDNLIRQLAADNDELEKRQQNHDNELADAKALQEAAEAEVAASEHIQKANEKLMAKHEEDTRVIDKLVKENLCHESRIMDLLCPGTRPGNPAVTTFVPRLPPPPPTAAPLQLCPSVSSVSIAPIPSRDDNATPGAKEPQQQKQLEVENEKLKSEKREHECRMDSLNKKVNVYKLELEKLGERHEALCGENERLKVEMGKRERVGEAQSGQRAERLVARVGSTPLVWVDELEMGRHGPRQEQQRQRQQQQQQQRDNPTLRAPLFARHIGDIGRSELSVSTTEVPPVPDETAPPAKPEPLDPNITLNINFPVPREVVRDFLSKI